MLRRLCADGLALYIRIAETALASTDPPWETFVAFARAVVAADTHAMTISLAGTFSPTPELNELAQRCDGLVRAVVEKAQADGVVRADDALDDEQLARRYACPENLGAPFVRASYVASADGAVSVGGRSEGLGSPADRRVFLLLRRLADVILVGAGTARAQDYRGARRPGL